MEYTQNLGLYKPGEDKVGIRQTLRENFEKIDAMAKLPDEHTWVSTQGQQQFSLPEGVMIDNVKRIIHFTVGGVNQSVGENITFINGNTFDLGEPLVEGVEVVIKWLDSHIPTVGSRNVSLLGHSLFDPASIPTNTQLTRNITVVGAEIGDFVQLAYSRSLEGLTLTGYVSTTDTVTAIMFNGTGVSVDLLSGYLRAMVIKNNLV